MITGQEENEPHVSLIGAYKVVQRPEGIRLIRDYSVLGEFPDAEELVFENADDAAGAGNLLSMAFQEKGISKGVIGIKIGDVLEYEVSGGTKGRCALYKLKDGARDGEPIKPKSPQKLVKALVPFFGGRR